MTAQSRLPAPLLFFVGLLVIWEPVTFALAASAALSRLAQFGLPAMLLLGFRALVTGLGLAVGRALWSRDPSALRAARAWLILHAIALVLTFTTPYFPSNRPPSTKSLTLALLLALDAAWWLWLAWSPSVRREYSQDP